MSQPPRSHHGRRWRDDWRAAAAALDEDRWQRLTTMTPDERRAIVLDLLNLAREGALGDDGEGLLPMQAVSARWWTTQPR